MKKLLIVALIALTGCATYPLDEEQCKDCCIKAGFVFKDKHKYGCECQEMKKPEIFTIKE